MQKLYNLFFDENSVIVFYKNNFSMYLVILSDFNDLNSRVGRKTPNKRTNKLDEIQDFLGLIYYACSVRTFDYT